MYPPLQGIALIVHKTPTHPCRKNNYLGQNLNFKKNDNFKTILISAQWNPLLVAKTPLEIGDENWYGLTLFSKYEEESNLSAVEIIYEGLKRTIKTLSDTRLDAIFVRDVPNLPTDM